MIASLQTDGNNVEFQNARRPKPGISGSTLTLIKNDLKRAYLHRTSGQFAELLQSNLLESVEKVKDRGVKQRDFAILRGARMPTAVVEAGFLSHPDEGMRVVEKSHRRAVMNGVIDGIREFDEFLVDSLNEEFTPPF
jgi:N-acetylmuramoyl-L-alanine amidase